jgi:hypothetical protein
VLANSSAKAWALESKDGEAVDITSSWTLFRPFQKNKSSKIQRFSRRERNFLGDFEFWNFFKENSVKIHKFKVILCKYILINVYLCVKMSM